MYLDLVLNQLSMIEPAYTLMQNYFLVKSQGSRDNFLEIALDHVEMVKQIDKYPQKNILLDHREVEYEVNQSDAFNLVALYQKHESRFKNIKLACCVKTKYLKLSLYWEQIAKKRGFEFKSFDSMKEAENWLSEGI